MEAAAAKQKNITLKLNYYLTPSLMLTADFIAVCLAIYTAVALRDGLVEILSIESARLAVKDAYLYLVLPTVYVSCIAYTNLYSRRMRFYQWAEVLFKVSTYITVTIIIVSYLLGIVGPISRLFMVLFWIISFLYVCLVRYLAKKALNQLGIWQRPVVIVGAGKTAELLANTFEQDTGIGYKIVGLVEDHQDRPLLKRYPNLGTFQEVEEAIHRANVQDVILATPGLKRKELVKLFYRIQPHVRNLTIVPDVFGVPIGNIDVDGLYNEKTILLKIHNNMRKRRNRLLKRAFDFCGSFFGTIAIAPFLLAIGTAIYLSSPGPVIFSHKRIGETGKEFPCYKFRSMVANAQEVLEQHLKENPQLRKEWEKDFKLKNDPRITKIGKFLRKTSLDELPQLLNVIKGEMSLVGPRPIINKEIERYGEYIHDYYLVKPGMTGYWQVSGRSDVDYAERVQMDAWYVRNWSLWQDIVLLCKTVGVVLGRKGAY